MRVPNRALVGGGDGVGLAIDSRVGRRERAGKNGIIYHQSLPNLALDKVARGHLVITKEAEIDIILPVAIEANQ
jgi:hypothetical protein